MLEHSRGKSGERRETDLNTLLDEYVSLAYHGMRAQETQFNCRIERSFDGSIGHLDLVPQDLGRVFINILNNAFYAVYEKSKTNGEVYEPAVAVSTVRFNGSVEIRINDNGPGVPETLRKKIFEPFYTTKPTGSGTGLGLSLSYDIVTQVHGGEMYVESIEGEQTTFVINIPVGAENGQFATEN
jgi:signal transduction histidine kinase